MSDAKPVLVDRRTTIRWVLVAAAAMPLRVRGRQPGSPAGATKAKGYGTDPELARVYAPGDLWPLTLTAAQRRTAAVLCDLIIPADARSPSASSVGVVDFIDEWISAPYPQQADDRALILEGFAWLDAESQRRFSRPFAELRAVEHTEICDAICYRPRAAGRLATPARFFARYRDLTAGGFYTSPAGMRDLQYVGNVPRATFEPPPIEVLRRAGLA